MSLGVGLKALWLKNDLDRNELITANSIGPNATIGAASLRGGDQTGVFGGELEAKLVYRLSHSWTVRSSYYLLGLDDVAFGTANQNTILGVATAIQNGATPPAKDTTFRFDSLTVQGFSVGAEYAW